ncbi:probable palmitoyltransferase ZDHHC11 [Trichechus manatus latirostris]|uniref:Palmitoyltransferase n=1 Tax=Trichechus manatus latirostris TaxID=127582 RepID=A0A2Y9QGN9_TRIMA|nr:probable palmitoyltransferase ZDHHC11 [Trichechus manatus latirostris]
MDRDPCVGSGWLQMDVCGRTRRVTPIAGSGIVKPRSPPPLPRVNGWSWQIHTPQVVVWTMLPALAFTSFVIFIPLFTDTCYCHLCGVTVSERDKLCTACNKCTAGFDHHFMWLNNCVGSRNYWSLFTSVGSALAWLLCLTAILMYLMVQYWVDKEGLRD